MSLLVVRTQHLLCCSLSLGLIGGHADGAIAQSRQGAPAAQAYPGVESTTSTYGGDGGAFHVSLATSRGACGWGGTISRDNYDRSAKDLDVAVWRIAAAFSVSCSLEVFGSVELDELDADSLPQPGQVEARYPQVTHSFARGFGDARVGAKFALTNELDGPPVSIGLRTSLRMPTGDKSAGASTGRWSPAVDLLVSRWAGEAGFIAVNVGLEGNSNPERGDRGHALNWGFAAASPLIGKSWQIQAEVIGHVYSDSAASVTDIIAGPALWIRSAGIFIRPAISINVGFHAQAPSSGLRSYTGLHLAVGRVRAH